MKATSKDRSRSSLRVKTNLKAGTWTDGGITAQDDWEAPVGGSK